jgi:lipopolysaccharide transport system ATP-binding protein
MSVAIWVDKVSKRYKLGSSKPTLRDSIASALAFDFARKSNEEEWLWALDNVSLSIRHGETVGIIGQNGAGKSTLLKILSKITYPTSGSFGVDGRIISLLEVGTGFHEELTGRENVFLNGSIMGMSKKQMQRQFDAIVEYSGIERFIDMPIKRYSTGMRLRLGFAVAAQLEPDILIVDEVLAVGDAAFQKKCLDTIQHLRAASRTILFVSHSLSAVENVCDRCIWIDAGQIRMDGDTRIVIREYMASTSNSAPEAAGLGETASRRGNGKLQFTRVEFLSPDGTRLRIVRSGDPLVIRLHYHANELIPFPNLGLRIFSEWNLLITETGTSHHGIYIDALEPGDGYLDLEIGCLNLVPGNYTISLLATDMDGALVYDIVEHATKLKLHAANVYQSGKDIDIRYGVIFFPQKWNLSGALGAANKGSDQQPSQWEPLSK